MLNNSQCSLQWLIHESAQQLLANTAAIGKILHHSKLTIVSGMQLTLWGLLGSGDALQSILSAPYVLNPGLIASIQRCLAMDRCYYL
jgi:hypothetical protein